MPGEEHIEAHGPGGLLHYCEWMTGKVRYSMLAADQFGSS